MSAAAQPRAAEEEKPAFILRPGVRWPDWSAIASRAAEDALTAILSACGVIQRSAGYGDDEDRVRRATIEGLAERSDAPDSASLAARTGLDERSVAALLDRLDSRDLVVRDKDTNAVIGAYPLTVRSTEHRVRRGDKAMHAMCAIDALGVGAMFGADVVIESCCRACGAPIHVATRRLGAALDEAAPSSTLVWSGLRYEEGCAATSLCTIIAFFCSEAHLESWRAANHPETEGARLTLEEALQVGRALFAPVLRPARGAESKAKTTTDEREMDHA